MFLEWFWSGFGVVLDWFWIGFGLVLGCVQLAAALGWIGWGLWGDWEERCLLAQTWRELRGREWGTWKGWSSKLLLFDTRGSGVVCDESGGKPSALQNDFELK